VVDYVFRVLGLEYLNRTDLAHVLPEDLQGPRSKDSATDHPVGYEHHRGNGNGKAKNGSASDKAPAAQLGTASASTSAAPVGHSTHSAPAAGPAGGQQAMLGKFSGDAPFCDNCGHITVRNGTCFKCLNCGNSMGCS